jgi:hypothetical protein
VDPKAARIEVIGTLAYGEAGWKPRLAKALGLTRQHIGAMMTGDRRVTPDVEERLLRALVDDIIPTMEASANALRNRAYTLALELDIKIEPPALK